MTVPRWTCSQCGVTCSTPGPLCPTCNPDSVDQLKRELGIVRHQRDLYVEDLERLQGVRRRDRTQAVQEVLGILQRQLGPRYAVPTDADLMNAAKHVVQCIDDLGFGPPAVGPPAVESRVESPEEREERLKHAATYSSAVVADPELEPGTVELRLGGQVVGRMVNVGGPRFYQPEAKHSPDCGTAFRGCAPDCPKDRAERAFDQPEGEACCHPWHDSPGSCPACGEGA